MFLQALFITVIVAVAIIWFIIGIVLIDESPALAAVTLIGFLFAMIYGGMWLIGDDSSDGVHKWQGGAGPSTICDYRTDDDVVVVGKLITTEQNVYTVCRDPR